MTTIEVCSIHKRYGDFSALEEVSLKVKSGELVALLGPSGSGKTTLLRIIAGLDHPDAGEVLLEGNAVRGTHAKERHVGFVFQHYALFKHMTVFENVAFGLRVRPKFLRPDEDEIHTRVMKLLSLVHLDQLSKRYPAQLSGGQRQRVALARALAVEPKVLLLDEPFGALDAKVRKELRRWLRRLHDDMHITTVFVTHDQEEAMEVADRVVVMSNGRIEQAGTPEQVYHSPRNAFVYDFLGNYNEFEGVVDEAGKVHILECDVPTAMVAPPSPMLKSIFPRYPGLARILKRMFPKFSAHPRPRSAEHAARAEGRSVKVFARPHEMYVAREKDEHEYILVKVTHINPAGSLVRLELERRNGAMIEAEIPKDVVDKLRICKYDDLLVRAKHMRVFEIQ